MKIQINDTNYSYYKKILEIIHSHLRPLYPPEIIEKADPLDILKKWEIENKSIAQQGLKATLQDIISQIKEMPPNLRISINQDLAANLLPSLNQLREGVDKIISRELQNERIKTLDEFCTIKEEVIDMNSKLSDKDRSYLDKCLRDFEFSRKGKLK